MSDELQIHPFLTSVRAKVALRDARPQKENAFKVELAKRAIVRALRVAAGVGP